jgi:hypothetical protein
MESKLIDEKVFRAFAKAIGRDKSTGFVVVSNDKVWCPVVEFDIAPGVELTPVGGNELTGIAVEF